MCDIYTRIDIRVRVWHMPRMAFDEVQVWCLVWGLLGFHLSHGGKGMEDAEGLMESRDMCIQSAMPNGCYSVLYHPSSGWVSIAFGEDPLHSDDDVTQYMWHSPLQYMASLLSYITVASVQPIYLHPSILLPSATHGPHHQLIFTKLS